MKTFCITLYFLDGRFHGKGDDGPEWPPSPFRLFQALLAASSRNGSGSEALFQWLEKLNPPEILSPEAKVGAGCTTYVPNNDSDIKKPKRAEKVFQPVHIPNNSPVHYLWKIKQEDESAAKKTAELSHLLSAVGWGIDLVAGTGRILCETDSDKLINNFTGFHWKPAVFSRKILRCPHTGSFADLRNCYHTHENRFQGNVYRPARKPVEFSEIAYERVGVTERRFVSFSLVQPQEDSDRWVSFDQRKAMIVSAWVRGQACKAAANSFFPGDSEVYVAGHVPKKEKNGKTPPRFSYLPIPSIGHRYADGRIRRLIVAEPFGGDGKCAEWGRRMLANTVLKNKEGLPRARLQPMTKQDRLIRRYTEEAKVFQTVTPVILPGFDDLKYRKAEKLVCKALSQAGFKEDDMEDIYLQKAPFHGGCYAPRSHTLPAYLQKNSAMHVQLTWKTNISGPLVLGSGRHFGLGLFAPKPE